MALVMSTLLRMPLTSRPIDSRVKLLLARLPPLVVPRSSVVLREFTLFSKLPRNLRLFIWSFVASDPRYIKLIALDRDVPASYQTWNSSVVAQPKNPPMVYVCKESRLLAASYYKRCFEKVQQQAETALEWTGTLEELQVAKRDERSSDGTAIFVNFASDILVLSQYPATAQTREYRSANIHDYNFKPTILRFCQRVQQVYSEKRGMPFAFQLLCSADIKDYRVEMDEDSKQVISRLPPIGRDLHMAGVRDNHIRALSYAMGDDLTKVLLEKWNVELR